MTSLARFVHGRNSGKNATRVTNGFKKKKNGLKAHCTKGTHIWYYKPRHESMIWESTGPNTIILLRVTALNCHLNTYPHFQISTVLTPHQRSFLCSKL